MGLTTVTVRPNDSASDHSGPGLVGALPTYHQALADNSDTTYVRIPGINGSFYGTGGWDYLLLNFATPAIPAGSMIAYVQPRFRAMREIESAVSPTDPPEAEDSFYHDIRKGQFGPYISWGYVGEVDDAAAAVYGGNIAYNYSGHTWTNAEAADTWIAVLSNDASIALYEAYLDFVITDIVVPTMTAPASGGTVTTGRPALNATLSADPDLTLPMTYVRQFQLATDAGFTTDVRTLTDTAYVESISSAVVVPEVDRLEQGVWYVRVRAIAANGETGAWSAGYSFTVAHVPTAGSLSPAGNADIEYDTTPTLSWVFSDPDTSDYQTAYQVQFWKESAPGVVLDSGKTVSAALSHTFLAGIDATWKNVALRWRAKVWDRDDVASGWSNTVGFKMRDLPVVTIQEPDTGDVLTVPSPTVEWSMVATGRTQAQYKVDIYNTTPTPDVLLATSGWQVGTATSWTAPSPILTVGPTFSAVVTLIDSSGLSGSDTNTFTATYTAPPAPAFVVNDTTYPTTALRELDWSGVVAEGTFYSWRVYRRETGGADWTLLEEILDVDTRTYSDYTSPSQMAVDYTVVQVVTQLGGQVESNYDPVSIDAQTLYNFMLVCPSDDTLNLVLYHVEGDSFQDEQEMASQNVPGRGRVVEYGTRYGQEGTLDISIRDVDGGPSARTQRLVLEALRSSGYDCYLTNPFGDVWRVSLGSASFTRIPGVGMHEMVDLSLAYSELSAVG